MEDKKTEKSYLVCARCDFDNFKDPSFWGCPRGGCEAEVVGKITIVTTIDKEHKDIHRKEIIKKRNQNKNGRK